DRTITGESGYSATLRRWYGYGLLLLGLAFLLFGARNLLQQAWVLLVDSGATIVPGNLVPSAMATMLTGLVVFQFHLRWTSRAPPWRRRGPGYAGDWCCRRALDDIGAGLEHMAQPPGRRVARQGQPVHHPDAGGGAHVAQSLARIAAGRGALRPQPPSLSLRL